MTARFYGSDKIDEAGVRRDSVVGSDTWKSYSRRTSDCTIHDPAIFPPVLN